MYLNCLVIRSSNISNCRVVKLEHKSCLEGTDLRVSVGHVLVKVESIEFLVLIWVGLHWIGIRTRWNGWNGRNWAWWSWARWSRSRAWLQDNREYDGKDDTYT